ncbi:MAG TPA: ArgE/DapE family deacylase [Candidatus Limnocylindrales bacterium]
MERAAADAIDPGRVREELADLVAIPSLGGAEDEIADHLARRLAIDGLDVRRIAGDLPAISADPAFPGTEVERSTLPIVAAHLTGARPGPRLMLLGHVDVVPPGNRGAWASEPFRPVLHDGTIVGRGACDMKGGLVAMLAALRALAVATRDGRDMAGEAVAVCVPAEEDGGAGAFAAVRAGYTADAAIIPEPTRLDIVTVHAGAITFRLSVPGRAAHASTRLEGVSAIDKLGVLMRSLEADEAARCAAETRPEMRALGLPYPTIIGTVRGGDWASTVPDRVVAEGRYGVRVGQAWSEAEAELRLVVTAANAADPFLRDHPATVEVFGGRFDPAEVPPDHPLPTGLADLAARVLGHRPALVGAPYGADMRILVNEGRTPTVMFGPGDVRKAHSANEWVAIPDVVACSRVLAAWLARGLATGLARV